MTAPGSYQMPETYFEDLCNLITNTENALRFNLRKRTLRDRSLLEPKLQALQDAIKLHEIFSSFQKVLEKVDISWLPKGRIEDVVQACVDRRYKDHDIERIFYERGGISGLLVLHLGTRNQNALFEQIYALSVELRVELAIRCGDGQINPVVQAWVDNFDRSGNTYDPKEEPPRLDQFAKEKEKAEKNSVTQPPPTRRIRTEIELDPIAHIAQSTIPASSTTQLNTRQAANSQPKDTLTCLATFPAFLLND